MAFYRIYCNQDTWITDKVTKSTTDLSVRATGSNHGRSPALNVFADKKRVTSGSVELARALLKFNTTELSGKVFTDQVIPSSSITYVLKMFDMKHADTVPTSYDLFAYPLSRSWTEGVGVDDDTFRDPGWANWHSASSTVAWTTSGSDFLTANYGSGSQNFDAGTEDLEVDVTEVVGNWLSSSIGSNGLPNNGLVVKLGPTEEDNGNRYYRKVFHGRESKYVDKIPYIEARWDSDVLKDNRNNFAYGQNNKLYMYNFVRGELTNVTQPVIVRIQDHVVGNSSSYSAEITASFVSTGIYSASFNFANASPSYSSSWVDIWFSASTVYMSSAFTPLILTGSTADPYTEFDVNVTNLKRVYSADEETRLNVHVRQRDYATHMGVLSSASLELSQEREYIEKMYYKIVNEHTGETIVPFATGSTKYTQLSYGAEGNYFNLWMKNFVPGFQYRILFLIDINQYDKKIIDDDFLFKVV